MSGRQLSWLSTCLSTAVLLPILVMCGDVKHISPDTLYIAGFFPITSKDIAQDAIGKGVLPAVHLALSHINNSPTMNRGYKLDIIHDDTKVSNIHVEC